MRKFVLTLFACFVAHAIAPSDARAADIPQPEANWGGASDAGLWDEAARAAVRSSALLAAVPTDIVDFCPGYASLDENGREVFWVALLSNIAARESRFDPQRVRWRAYDGAAHRPTFRRGLFQISIESARSNAYQCTVADADELTNPGANIACAVNILARSVAQTHAIVGAGRYWRSLSQTSSRHRFSAVTASSRVCLGR